MRGEGRFELKTEMASPGMRSPDAGTAADVEACTAVVLPNYKNTLYISSNLVI